MIWQKWSTLPGWLPVSLWNDEARQGSGSNVQPEERQLEALERELETLRAALGLETAVLRWLEGRYLVIGGACGLAIEHLPARLRASEGISAKLLSGQEIVVVHNASTDPTTAWQHHLAQAIRRKFVFVAAACASVRYEGKTIGVLGVFSLRYPREFPPAELNLLRETAHRLLCFRPGAPPLTSGSSDP